MAKYVHILCQNVILTEIYVVLGAFIWLIQNENISQTSGKNGTSIADFLYR